MNSNSVKRQIDMNIKDYFDGNHSLTFLIGAGCSVDSPSCLPAGRPMMNAILEYICPKDEDIDSLLLVTEKMRFEQLIEEFRNNYDNELKVIDYYGECEFPNIQHFFLADMIRNGHFVMTTNFDFLIERALMKSGVEKSNIVPVITQQDYKKYGNPKEVFKMGKNPIYKIHGSTKNIITNEPTKDSLVATIQAFGKNKDGLNVFQIEPFKRELFNNISNNRILVVMGYSGSDDFDIVPTLKILKNLKSIFWFNYVYSDGGSEQVFEIQPQNSNVENKIDQILSEIKKLNPNIHVYRIDTNTTRFIKEILKKKPKLNDETFSITPISWLRNALQEPKEIDKILIANKIYFNMTDYKNSQRLCENLLKLARESGSGSWEIKALGSIGMINYGQGKQHQAMDYYRRALKIAKELDQKRDIRYLLSSIGLIYRDQAKYERAKEFFLEAIKIDDEIGDIDSKGSDLSNIGIVYMGMREYNKSLEASEKAVKIFDKTGNLMQKGRAFGNIAWCYRELRAFNKAIQYLDKAINILEQIGDIAGVASTYMDIGLVYYDQGNYSTAIENFKKASDLFTQLGHKAWNASCLTHMGSSYYKLKDNNKALRYLSEALEIQDRLNLLDWKSETLSRIGYVYQDLKEDKKAIVSFKEAIQLLENIGQGNSQRAALFKSILESLTNSKNHS
ncbi:MAG: tetratricopeptide repeat protein [Candidatus Lokiarchaeota archaeon]|nr:tetratricopeptide repeat protein [Candidatus Lokiarchaeota archaeon]